MIHVGLKGIGECDSSMKIHFKERAKGIELKGYNLIVVISEAYKKLYYKK